MATLTLSVDSLSNVVSFWRSLALVFALRKGLLVSTLNLLTAATLGMQANENSYREIIKTSQPSQKEEI